MAFTITLPTRHTDAYAGTGFVHGGVLLALTEVAYAAFEEHAGYSKPDTVYSVQRETRLIYQAPLPWRDGVTIEINTSDVSAKGFTHECSLRSAATDRAIATVVHHYTWLDSTTGRGVPIPEDVQEKLREA